MNKFTRLAIAGLFLAAVLIGVASISSASSPAASSAAVPQFMPGPQVIVRASGENAFTHITPAAEFRALGVRGATFTVVYSGTWDAQAKTAFQYAVDIWAAQISSTVPISILATWQPLASNILGSAGPTSIFRDFTGAPQANTWYPVALANDLAGTDLNLDQPEITARFNSAFPDWYFGADGNPPAGKYDFASVVLHELGHGLGFVGSMNVGNCGGAGTPTPGTGCWGLSSGFPLAFDRFAENGSGQILISAFANPSAALGTQLTSGNIFFDGSNANAANGGARPKLYAPATWQSGSSFSHLDENTYVAGNPNSLMTPALSAAEAIHDPGPITRGIFKDMGWIITAASQPDLGIAKQVAGGLIRQPGDPVTFTLSISNSGTVTVTGVIVTDTLPAEILSPGWTASSSLTGTSVVSGSRYVWNLPNLAAGASGVITVYGTLTPSLSSRLLITNTAVASTADPESNVGNNSSTVVLTVVPPLPDVGIVKNVVAQPAFNPGGPITFTLSISNGGALIATGVRVTDTLPAEILSPGWAASPSLAGTSAVGGSRYVWNLPNLAAGASGVITVYGTITSTQFNFTIANTATISTVGPETDFANNSSSVLVSVRPITSYNYLPVIMRNGCSLFTITDPGFSNQLDMTQINADKAWTQCVQGDPGIVVAIIDTGVSLGHQDLAPNLIPGADFVGGGVEDGNGHGSNVAGIVGAALNGVGVVGVAPKTHLLPVRVLNNSGEGTASSVASGISYAADRAPILNLSLGTTSDIQTIRDAINYAVTTQGRLVVAAAGNCGGLNYIANGCSFQNQPNYPAAYSLSYPNIMAVAAVDSSDVRASFSNQGSYVTIAAPGVSIYNAYKNGGYAIESGTSQATPHVAGLAALVWARNPAYTAAQVRKIIEDTAQDLGSPARDPLYGWGRINVLSALGLSSAIPIKVARVEPIDLPAPSERRDAEIAPGRMLVKFKPGVNAASVDRALNDLAGVSVEGSIGRLGVFKLRVPVGQEWLWVDQLRTRIDVLYAEPDYIIRLYPDPITP